MREGKIAKTEWLLLGITAVFLCGLFGLAHYDRVKTPPVETEILVPQEELLPDLSPLNINEATEEELTQLPGIGEELARRIVEYRVQNHAFQTVEDIMKVSGIGQGKFDALKDRITVEEST